jgi:hypothetical protein
VGAARRSHAANNRRHIVRLTGEFGGIFGSVKHRCRILDTLAVGLALSGKTPELNASPVWELFGWGEADRLLGCQDGEFSDSHTSSLWFGGNTMAAKDICEIVCFG